MAAIPVSASGGSGNSGERILGFLTIIKLKNLHVC